MRRGFILFFCACWLVSVASMGLRASRPLARPQAAAPGEQRAAPGEQRAAPGEQGSATQQSEQALVKQYCVTCHNARTLTGGLSLDTRSSSSSNPRENRRSRSMMTTATSVIDSSRRGGTRGTGGVPPTTAA